MEKAAARDIYDLFAELAELANIDLKSPEFSRPDQSKGPEPKNPSNIFSVPSEKISKEDDKSDPKPWAQIAIEWKQQLAEVKAELSDEIQQVHQSLLEQLQLIKQRLDEYAHLKQGSELSNLHVTEQSLEINNEQMYRRAQPITSMHHLSSFLTSSMSELKRLESLQLQVEEMDADTRQDDMAQMEAYIAEELRKVRTEKALR